MMSWPRARQDLILNHRSVSFVSFVHIAVRKHEARDLSKRIFTCCSLYEVSGGAGQRMDGVTKLFCLSLHRSVSLLSSCCCAEPLERAQTGRNGSHWAAGQLEVMISAAFPYWGNSAKFINGHLWENAAESTSLLFVQESISSGKIYNPCASIKISYSVGSLEDENVHVIKMCSLGVQTLKLKG